jgi:hypothetical protein
VHRLQAERLENEHVEGSLDDVGVLVVHGTRRYIAFILIVKM